MQDVSEILAAAKLPEDEVKICTRADLVAEHERLDDELTALLDTPVQRFGGDPRRAELAARIVALEEQMAESTIVFRLRAMPRRKWRKLVAAHPPRFVGEELHPQDRQGVNGDTFFFPMIAASTVEPVLTAEQWTELLGNTDTEAEALEAEGKADEIQEGKLTSRQHERLQNTAWNLNRDDVAAPFSSAASRLIQGSAPA
jgi:hypothetical protein